MPASPIAAELVQYVGFGMFPLVPDNTAKQYAFPAVEVEHGDVLWLLVRRVNGTRSHTLQPTIDVPTLWSAVDGTGPQSHRYASWQVSGRGRATVAYDHEEGAGSLNQYDALLFRMRSFGRLLAGVKVDSVTPSLRTLEPIEHHLMVNAMRARNSTGGNPSTVRVNLTGDALDGVPASAITTSTIAANGYGIAAALAFTALPGSTERISFSGTAQNTGFQGITSASFSIWADGGELPPAPSVGYRSASRGHRRLTRGILHGLEDGARRRKD